MMLFVVASALVALAQTDAVNVATSYSVIHHGEPQERVLHKSPIFAPSTHVVHTASHFAPLVSAKTTKYTVPFLSAYNKVTQCPAPPLCNKSRYRTLDGSCNNLQNPTWGTPNRPYGRLLTPKYGDGVSTPTTSVTGQELPNSRLISLVVFGDEDVPDPQFTLANMQWGQIMTHDMSLQAGGTQSKKHATRCCTDDGKLIGKSTAPATCYPIIVPENDPAHSQTGTECINFVRTLTTREDACTPTHPSEPAEQLTTVTSWLDLSMVYGNSDQQNAGIRAFTGGRMATVERGGYEWPPNNPNATTECDLVSRDEVCYLAGDARVNQNPGLTIMQIMLLREHNRIADNLQKHNPHWDDELLFQEARRINIAQYNYINYYEWLPIFLGKENMLKNRLIYNAKAGDYINDYDPAQDPSVLNSHATAAFRYFHSQIEGRLDLVSEIRKPTGSLRLSDWFNRPSIIEAGDNYDFLARGMATQPEELTDVNFDAEIKHFLFRRGRPFGSDLRAFDIQRNRDHGLAGYNDYREFCGFKRAHSWEDFMDLISPQDVAKLQSLYASIDDVDLTVGGSLESHVNGALAGPTFLCILTEQFYRTRVADRHFFERGDKENAFTREQLAEIRKASMARIFCDNGNHVTSMQPKAFWRPSTHNQVVSCAEIPEVDLSMWKDLSYDNSLHSFHYFHNFKK
ncbi:AAEL006014-PA [Aedes aegypti]|uniref:AAEL006014-PA n=2 Tax=Aedes aegypti TaxID=7159 RepID=A0A1S4FCA3_AEDAE|nr:peroxidase [Aedes aegypti]EAT42428.1 AAEL006014-PA [Aedes aegypti]